MTSKLRRVALAIAYALVGAVLFGAGGILIGFSLGPDDASQALFNAAVGAVVGGGVGGVVGRPRPPKAHRRTVEPMSSPEATQMTHSLTTRAAGAVLAAAAFMPWYSSQARLDQETFLGNPLPLIDWVVLVAAIAVLVRPRLAMVAAAVGHIDVGLGALAIWFDDAKGLGVSLHAGLPLAFAACIALLLFRPKLDPPNEAERGDDVNLSPVDGGSAGRDSYGLEL